MYGAALVVGSMLLATAGLLVLADSGDLSRRLPTQVPPRSALRTVVIVGLGLILVGAVGTFVG